jgi:hypothetical protein
MGAKYLVFPYNEKPEHTFKFVSWMRAKDRAMINAHPGQPLSGRMSIMKWRIGTIEAGLQCSMLSRTTLAIVVVNNQCPRLIAWFKSLGNSWNCISLWLRRIMVVIERDIDIPALVVYSLWYVKTLPNFS